MENPHIDRIDLAIRLQATLDAREKQIACMAEMLAELNDKLNQALEINRTLITENKELSKKLTAKEELLGQELKDKEIIFSKLQTLEREYERLTGTSTSKGTPVKEKPEKAEKHEKTGLFSWRKSKTPNGKTSIAFIETSSGKIKKDEVKETKEINEKKEVKEVKEVKEMNPLKEVQNTKDSSPTKLTIDHINKQNSSGSEKGNEDEEDVLARIRKNLNLNGEKRTSSENYAD